MAATPRPGWIKLRGSLFSHPKVLAISAHLQRDDEFLCWLFPTAVLADSRDYHGALRNDVTCYVTVSALVRVWSAAREHSDNGTFNGIGLDGLDDIAGVCGFGAAMNAVGWATQVDSPLSVTLYQFERYNYVGIDATNAERQARWREKNKQGKGQPRNAVTRNARNAVTVTQSRVEESREDISPHTPPGGLEFIETPLMGRIRVTWGIHDQSRLKDLSAKFERLGADGEIGKRRQRLRDLWGDKADTPEALLKHWGKFGQETLTVIPGQPSKAEQAAMEAQWAEERKVRQ